jgi:hypothetical protein
MRSVKLSFHSCNWCGTTFDRNFVRCPVCYDNGYNQRLWWSLMVCVAVLGTLCVFAFWSIYALFGAAGRDANPTPPPGD